MMDQPTHDLWYKKHTLKHLGQDFGCCPVLPFHDLCSDFLHLYLNLEKKAVEYVFHLPVQLEKRKYDPAANALMKILRDNMNARMKEDFADKKFGGEGAFALTGDQVKVFMRGGTTNA